MNEGYTLETLTWGKPLLDRIKQDVVTDAATFEEYDSFIDRMRENMLPRTVNAAQRAYREWRFHIEMTRRGGVWNAERGMYL